MKKLSVLLFSLLSITSLQARWFWQPDTIIVYQEPTVADAAVTGICALGACVGLGIAHIIQHSKNKKQYKEYVQTFINMGYSKDQAKLYAKAAMQKDNGLQLICAQLDKEKAALQKLASDKEILKLKHEQDIDALSYQYRFIIVILSVLMLFGFGVFLHSRKK